VGTLLNISTERDYAELGTRSRLGLDDNAEALDSYPTFHNHTLISQYSVLLRLLHLPNLRTPGTRFAMS
jgi:hypothetical protein